MLWSITDSYLSIEIDVHHGTVTPAPTPPGRVEGTVRGTRSSSRYRCELLFTLVIPPPGKSTFSVARGSSTNTYLFLPVILSYSYLPQNALDSAEFGARYRQKLVELPPPPKPEPPAAPFPSSSPNFLTTVVLVLLVALISR